MKKLAVLSLILIFVLGCGFLNSPATSAPAPTAVSIVTQPPATATEISPTLVPPTPPAALGTIALDFVALLCDAQWMNGAQHLTACPPANADLSGGYAKVIDPASEGLPANTPVILTYAGTYSAALFLKISNLQSACRGSLPQYAALFGSAQSTMQCAIRPRILRRAGKISQSIHAVGLQPEHARYQCGCQLEFTCRSKRRLCAGSATRERLFSPR